jgi:diketogulonate reductase-like aldo/keto reductase
MKHNLKDSIFFFLYNNLMQFYNKYLKYKNKYLKLKNQIGGKPLTIMPQLCFGTAQDNLKETLKIALHDNGIRHIDGADLYGGLKYLKIIKAEVKKIPREELWITWKSNNTSISNIIEIIVRLECSYIDTFLVHHDSCDSDLSDLIKAKELGLIRFIGVSNCESIVKLIKYKTEYNIDTIQIQARPPGGSIDGKPLIDPNFIEIINSYGINVMLYGTMSGITNSNDFSIIDSEISNINKYYFQKYCLHKNNILITTSISGSSIERNKNDIEKMIAHEELLPEIKMEEIESKLKRVVLNDQSKL